MHINLKKFTQNDFDKYFLLVSNLKVMAMITERSLPKEEALQNFEKMISDNQVHPKAGHFQVFIDDKYVGLGKLEISKGSPQEAELGYMILPEHWGKGFASKIANILIETSKEISGLKKLFAIIDPANIPSRKILINNNFISREFKDFEGLPGEILELQIVNNPKE